MTRMNIHVGCLEDMGQRFIDAFQRAQTGEIDERQLTFLSLEEVVQ